jgi:hypothetical protein
MMPVASSYSYCYCCYCKQHPVRLLRFIAFVGHPMKQVHWEPGTIPVGKPASWQLSSDNYANSNEKP